MKKGFKLWSEDDPDPDDDKGCLIWIFILFVVCCVLAAGVFTMTLLNP